jgi:hypothetical protein
MGVGSARPGTQAWGHAGIVRRRQAHLRYAVEDALPLVRQVVATQRVERRADAHL